MPLYNPVNLSSAIPVSNGYSWAYNANNKALPAYTALPQTAVYAGVPVALLNAATATELNLLRVAVENLRVFTEALAQQHNAISLDMKSWGLLSTNP